MNTKHAAFTLVEMLVVIALLSTLMGIGAAGMRAADNMARETRTRATIAKLNQFIMDKYASYQYRRVGEPGISPQNRLDRLRKLQIYEMPDHWDEVNSDYSPRRIVYAKSKYSKNSETESAELLYQIVMAMPDAASAFLGTEVADTDGNGLNEFIDGWGTPIYFIRWPAGHCNDNYGAISKIQNGNDRDPFDHAMIDSNSYAVFPLIYSCGADRSRGIINAQNSTKPTGNTRTGCPGEGGGSGDSPKETAMYYDNITNHNL